MLLRVFQYSVYWLQSSLLTNPVLAVNPLSHDTDSSPNTVNFVNTVAFVHIHRRDVKTYKLASNACINFFLARVKYVQNFTLLCCKNELCCNFALLGGNIYGM